jgi:hypothetical protein
LVLLDLFIVTIYSSIFIKIFDSHPGGEKRRDGGNGLEIKEGKQQAVWSWMTPYFLELACFLSPLEGRRFADTKKERECV